MYYDVLALLNSVVRPGRRLPMDAKYKYFALHALHRIASVQSTGRPHCVLRAHTSPATSSTQGAGRARVRGASCAPLIRRGLRPTAAEKAKGAFIYVYIIERHRRG